MLCLILTYFCRILIFIYIFGYFFQKGHFRGIKHNSLKSDIFFHPIYIQCFPGSMFFRVWVQGPGSGFRSSLIELLFKKIQIYKESNISVYVIIFCLFFIKKVLACEIEWNTSYSDNTHMCLIAIAAIV